MDPQRFVDLGWRLRSYKGAVHAAIMANVAESDEPSDDLTLSMGADPFLSQLIDFTEVDDA